MEEMCYFGDVYYYMTEDGIQACFLGPESMMGDYLLFDTPEECAAYYAASSDRKQEAAA